jgi:hypothetical protein
MTIDDAVGYYTYRSFLNRPAGSPADLLWGEGELLLLISDEGAVSGTLAFPADAGAERKDFMDLSGTVTGWAPLSLHFTGKGRSGTAIADFEYEYDCRAALEWENAVPPQRAALVGTVRRNRDHGTAQAGATASFIAVQRDFVEPRSIPGVALIPEAVAMLATRTHRLRHTVWHSVRGDWFSPPMTDADRARLQALGWGLTDPPLRPDNRTLDLTNGAGEDFLYMHRRMIGMVHEVYDAAGKPRIIGWPQLPAPSTPQFAYREETDPADPARKIFVLDPAASGMMTPPPTTEFMTQLGDSPFLRFNKTARGFASVMRNVASNLRSPRVLSQLTLGAYGSLVEFTVHNWMHMRWATVGRNPSTGEPEVRDSYDIDPKWDVPQHDWLGDFHSSHVNPIFWRLHGWVDDCIGAGAAAHEATHPGQVQAAEVRGIPWFAPGPWVVKADPFDWPGASDDPHHHHGGGHGHNELATLEQVIAVLKEVAERPVVRALAAVPARRLPGFAGASLLGLEDGQP